jgi:glucoamylase
VPGAVAKASVRAVIRSIAAIGAAMLVAASLSGASEQPPEPLRIGIPDPYFDAPASGPFAIGEVQSRARPLGSEAPPWARRLYRRSLTVLVALTDQQSGAEIAGDREGWRYAWPRDAAAGAIALAAAGLRPEARRVTAFLSGLDLEAARYEPDGERVPGRPAAGDAAGWVAAARRAVGEGTVDLEGSADWRDRQDYGENLTGHLLGNAIAAGAPAAEIAEHFLTSRGLVRQQGTDQLDSAAAWAVVPFGRPGLRAAARRTLLALARESTRYGIPPIEGWTPGEVWTAPTAWSAWALVELGETKLADRLLGELRHGETPAGTLPERLDALTGAPTSTTPLGWSHAFAILALRARYP